MTDVIFCALRRIKVAALPEEIMRQALLNEMTQQLGYPMGHIALEKSLDQLPHLQNQTSLPRRRADLIVFAKGLHQSHDLYPLLLVECKATALTPRALRQLVGYNHFVRAYFIAVANKTRICLGWRHSLHDDFCFAEGLPPYGILLEKAKRICTIF